MLVRRSNTIPLPFVACKSPTDCPFSISCNEHSDSCDCSDILNMQVGDLKRNCSMAFEPQCPVGTFGVFCEYKCPRGCERNNKNGSCVRLQGTCDDFDKEQDAVLTASRYWYIILAVGVFLVCLLFLIYLIDYVCEKRREKKAAKVVRVPRKSRMVANTKRKSKHSVLEDRDLPVDNAIHESRSYQTENPRDSDKLKPNVPEEDLQSNSELNPTILHINYDRSTKQTSESQI